MVLHMVCACGLFVGGGNGVADGNEEIITVCRGE